MTFKMPAIKRKSVSHRHLSLHFTRLGVRAHRGPLCVLAYVGTSKVGDGTFSAENTAVTQEDATFHPTCLELHPGGITYRALC